MVNPSEFGSPGMAMFGVFDGHGHVGEKCARFVMAQLPQDLKRIKGSLAGGSDETVKKELTKTFIEVNDHMHGTAEIDDTLSGTTGVVCLMSGETCWVANVGDSRCIIVTDAGKTLSAKPLSTDQTPYRRDERARVRKCGARVLNMDQLEGLEAIHDDWDMALGEEVDEGGDPPRIWSQDGAYPGTAFTRSFGDSIAEELGVNAEPEIVKHVLSAEDQYLVVASDGVWEFLTNKEVVAITKTCASAQEAACKLWKASYTQWITKEVRTDDITIIVVDVADYFKKFGGGGGAVESGAGANGGKVLQQGSRRGSLGPSSSGSNK